MGVWLTPTLKWSFQMSELVQSIVDKGNALLSSMASPSQCLQVLETCIRPYITYSFATGAYTKNDILRLDSLLTQIAKRAWGLSTSVPNGFVHEDRL